jgi:WD repeat-containing protein 6
MCRVVWDVAQQRECARRQLHVRCLLYGASLAGSSLDTLVVATGTVFNEAQLWHAASETLLARCCGHLGVVFNCAWDPQRNRLATTSDDRTCRLWQLSDVFRADGGIDAKDFLPSALTPVELAPTVTLWGHSARVWRASFALNGTLVVTAAEDHSCRIWEADSGTCLVVHIGHDSRSIWSLAVSPSDDFCVTGGGDGALRTWPMVDAKRANEIDEEHDALLPPEMGIPLDGDTGDPR